MMSSHEKIMADLAKPLDPSKVASRDAGRGRSVPYLEGWYVVSAANGIFGFDGWSYEVLGTEAVRSWTVQRTNRTTGETYDDLETLYQARVSVTALGVTRIDIGTNVTSGDTPEAHDTAIKGAATDGLKRALRTFGAQFGNDLYDKTAGQSAPSQGQQRPQERATPHEIARGAGFANVGAMLKWALDEHKLSRKDVLTILGAQTPDAIALDTAQVDIEASLGVVTR